MDACLLTTAVSVESCNAGMARLSAHLTQFSFREDRDFSEEERREYRKAIEEFEGRWQLFVDEGLNDEIKLSIRNPFKWLRGQGDITIENRWHGIDFYLQPTSELEASITMCFDSSLWDAVHSDRDYSDSVVDHVVKRDFIALILLVVESFAPAAFGLILLRDGMDIGRRLEPSNVIDWFLVRPDLQIVRLWPFQVAGVRRDLIERRAIEDKRVAGTLFETASGYLVLDLIAAV